MESEPKTEMELAIDAEIEHGPTSTGEETEPAAIKEIHQPVRRNLVLGDDSNGEEVENELLETPDWTFEEPAKEAVAAIKESSPGASPVRSLKQNQQKQPQRRRRSDKEVNAVNMIENRAMSLRLSTGKAALTRIPSPPVLEEPIFAYGVGTTNELSSESKASPRSRPTTTQTQDDSVELGRTRTINRPLNKGKSPLTSPPTATQVQEESRFVGGARTTSRLLSKGKAPLKSRPKSMQPQNQQPSTVSRKPRPNPHAKSGTEEDMVANPQKAVVRSPVLVEETRTYQQNFGFCEKKPYRLVDYVRRWLNFIVRQIPWAYIIDQY